MLGTVVQIAAIGVGSETHAGANWGECHRAELLVADAQPRDDVETAVNRRKSLK